MLILIHPGLSSTVIKSAAHEKYHWKKIFGRNFYCLRHLNKTNNVVDAHQIAQKVLVNIDSTVA